MTVRIGEPAIHILHGKCDLVGTVGSLHVEAPRPHAIKHWRSFGDYAAIDTHLEYHLADGQRCGALNGRDHCGRTAGWNHDPAGAINLYTCATDRAVSADADIEMTNRKALPAILRPHSILMGLYTSKPIPSPTRAAERIPCNMLRMKKDEFVGHITNT